MKNLLYKELMLSLQPATYFFLALGALMLVPDYPYYVAFIYTFVSFIMLFVFGRENKDILFTASLPVRKSDVVKSRALTIVLLELAQIAIAVPFALIRGGYDKAANSAGTDANMALFGSVFIMYALFNIIFLPMFYKNAYKVAWPLIISCTAVTLYIFAFEIAVQAVPALRDSLDSMDAADAGSQAIVLAVGIVLFALTAVIAYKKAAKRFEKVDL